VGHGHVPQPGRQVRTIAEEVERVVAEGYRFIMSAPVRTYGAIQKANEVLGLK
jgi:hypothetical protein